MIRRSPVALMFAAAVAGIAGLFNSGGEARITRHDPGKHAGGYTPPPRMRSRRPMQRPDAGTPRVRPPIGRLRLLARLATGGRRFESYPPSWPKRGGTAARKRELREERVACALAVFNAHSACRPSQRRLNAIARANRVRLEDLGRELWHLKAVRRARRMLHR